MVVDLVGVMLGSQAPLLQLLAGELARIQERKGAQTVGSRFRDQLRDLLQRLDECAAPTHLLKMFSGSVTTWHAVHALPTSNEFVERDAACSVAPACHP